MLELLFLALAASVSTASFVLWSRSRRHREAQVPALSSGDRTALTLQIGDVVEHLDRDYLVEGALLLSETPRAARLCRLIDGATERFLYATTHTEGDAWLLAPVDRAPESRAEEVSHGGERMRLDRRWRAAALGAGKIGPHSFDAEIEVFEYVAPTGRVLLVLDGSGRVNAFGGERLLPHVLEFLPGRGVT
jgi:hypothetical protein